MENEQSSADAEFHAMHQVYGALGALDEDAQNRVVAYVCSRLGIGVPSTKGSAVKNPIPGNPRAEDADDSVVQVEEESVAEDEFEHLAELVDVTDPQTEADKALVAAYWLQVISKAESVEGFTINKELKHLGQGLSNVTRAIDALKNQKPALMMQLRKSGKSKQARKTYKVTHAGEKAVKEMING